MLDCSIGFSNLEADNMEAEFSCYSKHYNGELIFSKIYLLNNGDKIRVLFSTGFEENILNFTFLDFQKIFNEGCSKLLRLEGIEY